MNIVKISRHHIQWRTFVISVSLVYFTYYRVDGYVIHFCVGIHIQNIKKLLNFKIFGIFETHGSVVG
jgi:hypothetical protein